MKKILLTGSTGFIGKSVLQRLITSGFYVSVSVRRALIDSLPSVTQHLIADIGENTDWSSPLFGCDTVIHCAGQAHKINDVTMTSLQLSHSINLHGTINLARQAANAGVKRFIFISSIGVNGAQTFDRPFSEVDIACPHSFYAMSKYEAELQLISLSKKTGLEVVIIRPPLVYGKNAPGNFKALLKFIMGGWPLPFGGINNRLSLVGIDNLTDFILTCSMHPKAANQIFLISDDEDLSTTRLVRCLVNNSGIQNRIFYVPVFMLQLCFRFLGKSIMAQRLFGNLQIDITKAKTLLEWSPPISVDEGLNRSVSNYFSI